MLEKSVRRGLNNWTAPLLLIIIVLGGCGGDEDKDQTKTNPQEFIESGWSKFESADYRGALADFRGAIERDGWLSDAWNGAGWASGRLEGGLAEAADYFAASLRIDTTRYDALGGWAFTAYQTGAWRQALDKADSLLYRRPGWRFLHEPSLDAKDVHLMTAAAYYNLGDYSNSLAVVVQHLNPTFEADMNTPAGRRELLEEIERLRQIYG